MHMGLGVVIKKGYKINPWMSLFMGFMGREKEKQSQLNDVCNMEKEDPLQDDTRTQNGSKKISQHEKMARGEEHKLLNINESREKPLLKTTKLVWPMLAVDAQS